MAKIRRLLQCYVFARPQVRFSLKVLKAKDTKGDWAYVPDIPTTQEKDQKNKYLGALVKFHGKTVLEKCTWVFSGSFTDASGILPVNSAGSTDDSSDCQFQISGIIINPQCVDPATLMNLGHFVSIDCRPMSCSQGILREVVRHYRACVRRTFSQSEVKRVNDPLLILNIACQRASYDVNIEPGKDDVLFHRPQELLLAAQTLFNSHYREVSSTTSESQPPKQSRTSSELGILLARKPNNPQSSSIREGAYEFNNETLFLDDESERISELSAVGQVASAASPQLQLARRQTSEAALEQESRTADARGASVSEQGVISQSSHFRGIFPSVRDAFEINLQRTERAMSDSHALSSITLSERCPSAKQHQIPRDPTCSSNGASSITHSRSSPATSLTLPQYWREATSNQQRAEHPFTGAYNTSPNRSYQSGRMSSASPGLASPSRLELDHLQTPQRRLSNTTFPLTSSSSPIHPDLALTLDYESRKQQATLDYKKKIRKELAAEAAKHREEAANSTQQTLDSLFRFPTNRSSGISPHQSRYEKALAALQSSAKSPGSTPSTNNNATSVTAGATPFSQPFVRGKKTPKQLLNRGGKDFPVVDLVMPVSWTLGKIRREMRRNWDCDGYINDDVAKDSDGVVSGFDQRRTDGTLPAEWEARVRSILGERFPGGAGKAVIDELPLEMQMEMDLQPESSGQE